MNVSSSNGQKRYLLIYLRLLRLISEYKTMSFLNKEDITRIETSYMKVFLGTYWNLQELKYWKTDIYCIVCICYFANFDDVAVFHVLVVISIEHSFNYRFWNQLCIQENNKSPKFCINFTLRYDWIRDRIKSTEKLE